MKKLITATVISASLFSIPSLAQNCEERGNEIINIYQEVYTDAAEMAKVNEPSKEFCDEVAILWETAKNMMAKNSDYMRDCDAEGVFGESEPLIQFMIGAIGASNKSCIEENY